MLGWHRALRARLPCRYCTHRTDCQNTRGMRGGAASVRRRCCVNLRSSAHGNYP